MVKFKISLNIGILIPLLLFTTPIFASSELGLKEEMTLLEYWSPIFYQQLNEDDDDGSPGVYVYHEDYITSVDYDGDWIGVNNWDNFGLFMTSLYAVIYDWKVETKTHYFLGYAVFHPRDWDDGQFDSEHENDMEGVLVVIEKEENLKYGNFLYLQTLAHNNLLDYIDHDISPSKDLILNEGYSISGDVEFEDYNGNHPKVFIEAKGHGIYGDPSNFDYLKPYIKYYYGGISDKPSDSLTGDDDTEIHEDVSYNLVKIDELWSRRDNDELFFSFGKFLGNDDDDDENSSDDCGSGALIVCLSNSASVPWGWSQGSEYSGELWFEPSRLGSLHFNFTQSNFVVPKKCGSREYFGQNILNMCDDQTIPIFELFVQSRFTIDEGTRGNEISWRMEDDNPDTYNITKNGEIVLDNTQWDNGPHKISIDGLTIGDYSYLISIKDTGNNYNEIKINVTVIQPVEDIRSSSSNPSFILVDATSIYISLVVIFISSKKSKYKNEP